MTRINYAIPVKCLADEHLFNRITERIMNIKKKYWHYCGKVISKEDAIRLLK